MIQPNVRPTITCRAGKGQKNEGMYFEYEVPGGEDAEDLPLLPGEHLPRCCNASREVRGGYRCGRPVSIAQNAQALHASCSGIH